MTSLLLVLILAATPAAPAPRLVAEPARTVRDQLGGGSQPFRIQSAILGQTRRVLVHLPASFARSAATRRYPTTIVFDGEWMLRPIVTTSEVLSAQGQIPESVIVSIEKPDDYDGRVHDLTPPGLSVSGSSLNEGGDRFLDFIEKERITRSGAGCIERHDYDSPMSADSIRRHSNDLNVLISERQTFEARIRHSKRFRASNI